MRNIKSWCVLVAAWTAAWAVMTQKPPAAQEQRAATEASTPSESKQEQERSEKAASKRGDPEKAWGILRDGAADSNADKRAKAVRTLGLISGNIEAESMALKALKDEKANVRGAGATALGQMGAMHARKSLEALLEDDDPTAAVAAARALLMLKDSAGYEIYYEILTGERKASKGLIKSEMANLKDKKKLAQIGLDEGIGFIPFAGIPYGVLKMVLKNDDSAGVRAAAAKRLADDPDPGSGEALEGALEDKNWVIRAAALEALAQRNDPKVLSKVAPLLDDEKEEVQYAAAACTVQLSQRRPKKKKRPAEPVEVPAKSN